MKKLIALLSVVLVGVLAWMAAGPDQAQDGSVGTEVPVAMGAPPPVPTPGPPIPEFVPSGEPLDVPPPDAPSFEPPVPPEVIAPIATETAPPPLVPNQVPSMRDAEAPRAMIVPVVGIPRSAMRDTFDQPRGGRRHEAIDILAPRGTPVIATDDGIVKKLFTSKPGGLTVYQFDPDQRFCYYYAHLDAYAPGLREGQLLRRGDVIGYVGTTGNSSPDTPHLHFALIRLDKERRWWTGTYVNPYPFLSSQ